MRYRIEKDSLGERQIPAEVYYGIHTARSKETFQLTKHGLNRQMIKALAQIKKIATKTNLEMGLIEKDIANVIILSCDEILNGRLHGQFITDLVQGGSGTSMNMNANEVIANRANEMLGGEKGKYDRVHPISHVNLKQSSGEVVLLAGKMSSIRLIKKLMLEARKLLNVLNDKSIEFGYSKSESFSIGNEIKAFANVLDRDMKRVDSAMASLYEVNIGASYYETEQIINDNYIKKYIKNLVQLSGEAFYQTKEIADTSRNLDGFLWVSSSLKSLSINLSKIANDLRVMVKDKRVNLPEIQESPYVNAKDNTVVLEVVNQISFYIMGNDLTVARAVEAGEYEKNIYLPMIYACLFETINLIRRTMRIFREKAIEEMQVIL